MEATPYAYLLIRQFEGLRLTAYHCPSGIMTIGYGHTKDVHEGHGRMISGFRLERFQ